MIITLGKALKKLMQEIIKKHKGTTMTQLHLFNQKPILEVLKPIRFQEKIQLSTPQKSAKNEKS